MCELVVIAALRLKLVGLLALQLGLCLVEACGGLWRGLGCGLLFGTVEGLRHLLGGQVAGTAGLPGCCAACCGLALCGLHERGALSGGGTFADGAADLLAHVAARGCAR